MRIIPDSVHVSYATIDQGLNYSSGNPMYHQDETIEITDIEWEKIVDGYDLWLIDDHDNPIWKDARPINFAEYLRELIMLRVAQISHQ